MYRRPKFLEILLDIRQEMAAEADHDIDVFIQAARSGKPAAAPTAPRPKASRTEGRPKTAKGRRAVAK